MYFAFKTPQPVWFNLHNFNNSGQMLIVILFSRIDIWIKGKNRQKNAI